MKMRISEVSVYVPLEEYYKTPFDEKGSLIRKYLRLKEPDTVLQRINKQRMFKDHNKVEFSVSVSKRERKR